MFSEQPQEIAHTVHGHARVLREEIAGVIDLAAVGIDQRIVVGAVGLHFDLPRGDTQAIDDRPDELWQATQRIPVLDELAAAVSPIAGRLVAHELRAREQLGHLGRRPYLPRMRLDRVNEGRKRLAGGQHGLRIQRVYAERQRCEVQGAADCIRRNAGTDPGAVVESKTFLRLQCQRRQSELLQRGVRIQLLTAMIDLESRIQPQDRTGDVGERHEIAARTD